MYRKYGGVCVYYTFRQLSPPRCKKKKNPNPVSFMGQVGRSNGEGGGVGVKERGGQGEGELSETPAG